MSIINEWYIKNVEYIDELHKKIWDDEYNKWEILYEDENKKNIYKFENIFDWNLKNMYDKNEILKDLKKICELLENIDIKKIDIKKYVYEIKEYIELFFKKNNLIFDNVVIQTNWNKITRCAYNFCKNYPICEKEYNNLILNVDKDYKKCNLDHISFYKINID